MIPEILRNIRKNYKGALMLAATLLAFQPRMLSRAEIPKTPYQWYLSTHYGISDITPQSNYLEGEIGDIGVIDTGHIQRLPDSINIPTNFETHAATTDAIIRGIQTNEVEFQGIHPQENTTFFLYGTTIDSVKANLEKAVNSDSIRTLLLEFHFPGKTENEIKYYQPIKELIEKAVASGKLVLGACGNEKQAACTFPSTVNGVITVSATNEIGLLTATNEDDKGSNWQESGAGKTDICAPGTMVNGVDGKNNILSYVWGTSIALAVAGASAEKIWDLNPDLSRDEIIQLIFDTAQKNNVDPRCGHGIINIANATNLKTVNGTVEFNIRGQSKIYTEVSDTKEMVVRNATGTLSNVEDYKFSINVPPVERTYIAFKGEVTIDGKEYTCMATIPINYTDFGIEQKIISECDPSNSRWGSVDSQTAMLTP